MLPIDYADTLKLLNEARKAVFYEGEEDDEHLRRAANLVASHKPWPDADRKRQHAAKSVDLARRMVASGDQDAALEQVRTALSLAARARLLRAGVFPGARDELPQQLAALGLCDAGEALASTIHTDNVALGELAMAVDLCDALVSTRYDAGRSLQHQNPDASLRPRGSDVLR